MTAHTVRQLAKLAGVSVRTLHHYDHIGLLTPSNRTAAGYRLYAAKELLRLQQILFFKELDLPLHDIKRVLDHPDFDQVKALREHRQMLQLRTERLTSLLKTIDKTIRKLTEDNMPITDEELYEGFTDEQRVRYQREVRERYDPKVVAESNRRARSMSKGQWRDVKDEGGAIAQEVAGVMDLEPGAPEVQTLIARQHAWIENFYTATPEIFNGLGQLYEENEEFRAFYDKYRPGLAEFMRDAMAYYADHALGRE